MARDEVVRWGPWSSVVGEYGVLLTEMGSMEDLCTPIKTYPRIKYTCMTASKKYVAMGSSTGGLYVFDRQTLKHSRFISNKDGPIHAVCFAQRRSLLAVATSLGILLVWEVSSRHREKPKLIRRSEEHKNTTVSALCWDDDEGHVFAGDVKGVVSVIQVPQANKLPHSVNKGLPLLHSTGIVAKAHTAIVQLDCVSDKLLVSTMTKCAVVDLKSLDCVPVGVKLRDGLYGSCFFKETMSDSPAIYSARPGSRLWEASIDGQVMSTQQYKKLLGTVPVTILGCRRSAIHPVAEEDFPPQSVNFAKLLLVRERFLVTWHGTSLYIMDPILGQLVAWYSLDSEVLDVCCVGKELYVYDAEGCVKWFGLLSVKECVTKLYEMGEVKQCLTVLLDCKQYIIPGSARDLVPVSLVATLREGLCEENDEDDQEVILGLEELEREMEPATEASDNPPSYHGNLSMTDSPDTLSMCSDAFTDELDISASSSGVRDMGDHLNDESVPKKLKKQWSGDISFEGMLMSAAAAAKKFTAERQKGMNKLKRSQSAGSPRTGRSADSTADQHQENVGSQSRTSSDTEVLVGQPAEGVDAVQEAILEEQSPVLGNKTLEHSPCHSDDSESRQSGNEGGTVEEEASEKKEKLILKDKRKRKKKVVTVDIDSPQVKLEDFLGGTTQYGRSSSFRGTSSSTDDTEVRSGRLSEPVSPVQSERPPAIPAMLSKAKGLLKKKRLKVPSDEGHPSLISPSASPTAEEREMYDTEEETQKMKCPPEVEELIQYSTTTRNEVKNPVVLFSIRNLCRMFEDWIPKLHEATKSCFELNTNNNGSNSEIDLKSFMSGSAFHDVSYLTQMCFDCGVYGVEGLGSLEDAHSQTKITSKTVPDVVLQDSQEITDVGGSREGHSNEIASKTSETSVDHEFAECVPISREGVMGAGESNQVQLPLGNADGFILDNDSSTSRSSNTEVKEGNSNEKASDEDSVETTLTLDVPDINSDCTEPLKASSHEENATVKTSTDSSISSHEEMFKHSLSAQDPTSSLHSAHSWERVCRPCENEISFCKSDGMEGTDETSAQMKNDNIRSRFLSYYFFLFDVKRLRRTLFMSKGDRRKTWSTFMDCLSGLVSTDDLIARYIKEGDARRALHELHDGMDLYSVTLLYHLTCLYEHDSRETMLTCARMFPDVHPWEVMEICRHSKSRSLDSSSADFVFYVEQLMRWRAEVGNTKEQTVSKVCEDMGVTKWWFHCSLIGDSATSRERFHCQHCGKPRPGSHTVQWQNADHLQQLIDFLCQKDPKELGHFMDLCWKHGYWSGLTRLCVRTNLRREALNLVVSLSDLKLIKDQHSWGPLPKSLNEWKHLLELLLSRDHHDSESRDSPHVCTPLAASDWLADLTWSNVIRLMLERLGAGHTVNLLQALPLDTPPLTTDFYYSCLLGAVIERRQRTLIHELLKKLDSYLWSQRSGALAPKLNNFRKEEEVCGPKSKEDIKPQLDSLSQFRSLEDGASNWGQNIRLSDGECLVCSLKLCEQISTSNQGLLMFECGHVFHKHCVPEAACVLCFQQNLTSLGASILS